MTEIYLTPEPLTQQRFAEFGDVIELTEHDDVIDINYGMTQRFNNMANLDITDNDGMPLFNIFRARPIQFPFTVEVIERHPLSSQLFYPLHHHPFFVLVASHATKPNSESLKLFLSNGYQGINYKRNTWHHYLLALDHTCDFVVVDRGANDDNCEEHLFNQTILIQQP